MQCKEYVHIKTGKHYQVRDYDGIMCVFVDLGCGWFPSDYTADMVKNSDDFQLTLTKID